jgi:hypothetical protein
MVIETIIGQLNLSNAINILELLVTIFGFWLVISQLRLVRKEADAVIQSMEFTNESELYDQNADVRKIFLEHPDLRPFFFEGRKIPSTHEKFAIAVTIAELFLNYLEQLTSKSKNLPVSQAWHEEFLKNIFESSPLMREILDQRPERYAPDFRGYVTQLVPAQRTNDGGRVEGRV